ncbi:RNA polymerase sigma-70 factor (ECF subfamily) [Azospirillum lipoferum]|uniref:Sigma-70 family RNA polymerase sigma factor n=1 Tax=Azospirillum lipoferum TaxID=193 RepID=A0A5A9FZU4_AZOLI|nr:MULTISPECIES: sigma-70 family RNA polymerase sigma factor [Azospirillum]KAA0587541.1 sigma-70 family RNA polymerase sigma factor [Azospirillum lipoferum]MCP1608905.1 RNA polymerase sigma-70 factor (ECF subfamily) [Azospirillum lipoferum]MDW5535780.1 sigma-70 family RNA polymerase sigma factor [Azospirillum sp. NL1]
MANHVATTLSHRLRVPAEPVPFGAEAVGRTRSDGLPTYLDQDTADARADARMETHLTVHAEARRAKASSEIDEAPADVDAPDAEVANVDVAIEAAEEEEFHPDPNAPPDPAVIRQIEEEIPRLRRFARAMVRDATLADDLVQECLERALSRLHLWRPGTNLRAWLFTILRNLHINGVRRRQPVVDIDAEAQAAIGAAPGSQFVRMELRDLRRALALLPNEQREVVLLIGLEGISYNEAADILGISIGTVKSRLSRGRRALRLLMEGQNPSDDTDA